VYRATGLLDTPIEINPSAWSAAATFVREGVVHILRGPDHLLFVLCLTLASATLAQLAWRVTGFTVGHTATLIAGFFGLAPQAPWFIPAVETAIAASIALAALLLLRRRSGRVLMPGLTLAIGLIHGFGFSFSLREMLQLDGPHLWLSLLSFNLGVEIGQIAFAVAVWLLAVVALQRAGAWQPRVRAGIALGCTAVSLFWIYERGHALLA
jgi:hydrogenase/urease accessory protein HupE